MFLGGTLAAGLTVFSVVQWARLGRIPAGLPGGGLMGAMEVASVGLTGSIALVLLGATWSLFTHAARGRRGPIIPAGALRVLGAFLIAMLGVLSVFSLSEGLPVLSLITLPLMAGLALLFRRSM